MACEVCEHCQGPLSRAQLVVREGFSYHKKCHKCYVCSETNLLNADVFKGVIFCSSCSQRIFQGCSTAKRTKNAKPKPQRSRSHRRRDRIKSQDKRAELSKVQNRIIELAGFVGSTDTDSRSLSDDLKNSVKLNKNLEISTGLALQVGKHMYEDNLRILKKSSAEIGITTDVTQELLQRMGCPVVNEHKTKSTSPRRCPKRKKNKLPHHNKINCSDLRVAELGVSTEIANMTLKNKSELPVIIKPEFPIRNLESSSVSILNQESDASSKAQEWRQSTYTTLSATNTNWLERWLSIILKIPYRSFKRNILDRSSLINILLSSPDSVALMKRFNMLLHEEITQHQRRGIKRLYSTIIRRKKPYKLGWLRLFEGASVMRFKHPAAHHKKCKHYTNIHSYRCMRAKVMRLAGPTKSELANFRKKMKSFMAPAFMQNIIEYNKKYAIMMSQACGSEIV